MATGVSAQLSERPTIVLSISGVRQDSVQYAQRIVDAARECDVVASLTLTAMGAVRKNSSMVASEDGVWRLRDDETALGFIHDCHARGHELTLGGLGPLGVSSTKLLPEGIEKAEFRRLGKHEARLRIGAAQRQLASMGLETSVFTPTRWAASEGACAAAAACGYDIVADAYTVRGGPNTYAHRVLAIGDGFGGEKWWRRQVKKSAMRMAEQFHPVRLSINAGKAHKAGAIDDVRRIVERLTSFGYVGGNYGGTYGTACEVGGAHSAA